MEGGLVIEGARNCFRNLDSGPAGEHEEAWRRVSQDPSWMHSCNHMWGLISEKLSELKDTRDHNAAGKIVVCGAAAQVPAAPAGPPLAPLPGPPPVSQNLEDRRTGESTRTGRNHLTNHLQPRRPEELQVTDVAGAILKAKVAYMNTRGAGGRWKGVVDPEETKGLQLARQGMHTVKPKEENMYMAQVAMAMGENSKRKRDAHETERKEQGRGKRSRHTSHGDSSEVATAPKDTSENDKLRVVLFRTENGRAVHVPEKSEIKSDPVSVVEAARAHGQEATKSSADEGADRDPLPVKRKRRMDEVMEDGEPAKRPGTAHTFIRQVKAAPAPSATHQAHEAKATATATGTVKVVPGKAKPHVVQITSIDDVKTKKKKKPDPEEPELEFKCGCTSKELGDRVGHLKAYKSGELVIFCECEPGCPQAGKPLSPSVFERHAGRGAAKKWKHTVWLVVGGEKVPLHKVGVMAPYLAKNKGRRHLVRT